MVREALIQDQRATARRLIAIALLLAACALAWAVWSNPDAFNPFRGTLSIISEPSGAQVLVEGEMKGTTPLEISGVREGRATLLLRHPYFEDIVHKVDVQSGETSYVTLEFLPAFGGAHIISNPAGAEVELNGEYIGAKTPYQLTDLSTGEHTVTVHFPHHASSTKTFEVSPQRESEVRFNMRLIPWGTLTVVTDPADALVELVGHSETYHPGIELPAGEYTIQTSRERYPTKTERLRIGMGEVKHQVVLERRMVPLNVTTHPENAEVSVEYVLGGIPKVRPYSGMAPMGTVTVVTRAPGYRTKRLSVDLTRAGASRTIRLQRFSFREGDTFQDPLKSSGYAPLVRVIAPGVYKMGDHTGLGSADEAPVHEVRLTQPFAIGVYELRADEYARYLATRGREPKMGRVKDLDHPAVFMTPEDAEAYLAWLSKETTYQYRLPSEAEWEYIARAGVETPYVHGDDEILLCEYANIADQATKQRFSTWDVADCNDNFPYTAPVGSLKPNAFGLYDVLGNVSEWVADCWSNNYEEARPDEVPYRPSDVCHHVFRGGSWDSKPDTARLSYRQSSDKANDDRGLRVVREL